MEKEIDADFERFWVAGVRPFLGRFDAKTRDGIKEIARLACWFGYLSAAPATVFGELVDNRQITPTTLTNTTNSHE
jgi:hypothetical protein